MSTESNFSFTTKLNNDLFTIRGDDFNTFTQHLLEVASLPAVQNLLNVLNNLTPAEQAVATAFDATVVTPPIPNVVPQQSFAPVPPAATPAPAVSAPACHHGNKVAKKGVGAKGEWKAWMCPAPKGTADQCSPAWVAKNSPEWNTFPA